MDLSVGSKREKKGGAFAARYPGVVWNKVMLKGCLNCRKGGQLGSSPFKISLHFGEILTLVGLQRPAGAKRAKPFPAASPKAVG